MTTENLLDYQEKSIAEKWRAAIARLGFWTLALTLAAPASLHCIEIFFLRSPLSASSKPSKFPINWIYVTWYPRKWIDVTSVYLSLLLSLSYWFFWAENRVFRRPNGVAVVSILYLNLTLAWDLFVFAHGAIECGIVFGLASSKVLA